MKQPIKRLSILFVVLYLLIPLVGTILYSFSTKWVTTVLPEGWTLQWYQQLLSDRDFFWAIGRTLFLASVSVTLSLVLIVPVIFAIYIYFPRWEKFINVLVVICYSVPGIISVMSLTSAYSGWGLPKIFLVFGSYVIGSLPLFNVGILNSLRAIDARRLIESAEILGANKSTAFWRIIIPNISKAVIATSLFRFSSLFGEYVTVNLILGGGFETVQTFLRKNININGHYSSVIVVTYFAVLTILTLIALNLTRRIGGNKP